MPDPDEEKAGSQVVPDIPTRDDEDDAPPSADNGPQDDRLPGRQGD